MVRLRIPGHWKPIKPENRCRAITIKGHRCTYAATIKGLCNCHFQRQQAGHRLQTVK